MVGEAPEKDEAYKPLATPTVSKHEAVHRSDSPVGGPPFGCTDLCRRLSIHRGRVLRLEEGEVQGLFLSISAATVSSTGERNHSRGRPPAGAQLNAIPQARHLATAGEKRRGGASDFERKSG